MAVGPWQALDKVARAWCCAAGGIALETRFQKAYTLRLRQTSYATAVWGALADVGLRRESRHLKDWLTPPNPLPRRERADGTLEVDLSGRLASVEAPGPSPCGFCDGCGRVGFTGCRARRE